MLFVDSTLMPVLFDFMNLYGSNQLCTFLRDVVVSNTGLLSHLLITPELLP